MSMAPMVAGETKLVKRHARPHALAMQAWRGSPQRGVAKETTRNIGATIHANA